MINLFIYEDLSINIIQKFNLVLFTSEMSQNDIKSMHSSKQLWKHAIQ